MRKRAPSQVFLRQPAHLLVYLLVSATVVLVALEFSEIGKRAWGMTALSWLAVSIASAGLHQGWIMLFWRLELHGQRISSRLGRSGFLMFRVGFVVFGSIRFLTLVPVSAATSDTLPMPPLPAMALIVVTTPFILWGLYSVVVYFGITRAFGADHFDPSYRTLGLEKRGIFRFIPNSMYTVVLVLLYHPGLLFLSLPGLVLALGHHVLVWTHYFCTEKPDMQAIYG